MGLDLVTTDTIDRAIEQKDSDEVSENRPLVLVADDDEINRFLCRESLKASGFEVIEAQDGSEALRLTKEQRPEIILLDVVMEPMDGFTACRHIRNDRSTRDIPVVMMTGTDGSCSVAKAYDAGATDFINKPITPVLLSHRLRYVHRASLALNQLQASREELALAQRMARLGGLRVELPGGKALVSTEACEVLGLPRNTTDIPVRSLLRRLETCELRRLLSELSDSISLHTPLSTEIRYRFNATTTSTLSIRAEVEFELEIPKRINFYRSRCKRAQGSRSARALPCSS